MMRPFPITAALIAAFSISTVAMAQTAPAAAPKVQSGQRVYSSDGAVIGRVEYVEKDKDGTPKNVGVIYDMRMVHIPADSLSAGPNGIVTTLKRSDVSKLN
jgi:hypothetical protein